MKRTAIVALLAVAVMTMGTAASLLVACGGGSVGSHHGSSAPGEDENTPPDPDASPAALPVARTVIDGAFATSLLCADCHANAAGSDAMRDSANRPIAPFDLWRSSMMANAVRDPLWRAVVSAEMAAAPSKAEAIQAKCFSCHGAMASREGHEPSLSMVHEDSDRGQILLDGVSCTVCHQITSTGLGTEASYTAHFELNTLREAYGPHENPREMPMEGMSGYRPVQAAHTISSALCGSCHTVLTEALDADGELTGIHFAEQTPYLEWRNSVFNDEVETPTEEAASCQACHMPTVSEDGVPIRTAIADPHGMMGGGMGGGGMGGGMDLPERSPFGRHVLVGGNTAVPQMLLENRAELSPNATSAALRATIQAARHALQNDTARLSVLDTARQGDEVRVQIRVENLVGHKLPTGIPVRRMWLHVRLVNGAGAAVFESGAYNSDGQIIGLDGAPLASEEAGGPVEPHRDRITRPEEVQIYEDVMADSDGSPTFRLMRAASHRKDNRLLPRGWSSEHEDASRTAAHGNAAADANFGGGEDLVRYEIHAPVSSGPYTVEARLLYQAIGQRFAAELLEFRTPEVDAFARYFTSAVRAPEEVAVLSVAIP